MLYRTHTYYMLLCYLYMQTGLSGTHRGYPLFFLCIGTLLDGLKKARESCASMGSTLVGEPMPMYT